MEWQGAKRDLILNGVRYRGDPCKRSRKIVPSRENAGWSDAPRNAQDVFNCSDHAESQDIKTEGNPRHARRWGLALKVCIELVCSRWTASRWES